MCKPGLRQQGVTYGTARVAWAGSSRGKPMRPGARVRTREQQESDPVNTGEGRQEAVANVQIIDARNLIWGNALMNKGSLSLAAAVHPPRDKRPSGRSENPLPEIIAQPGRHFSGAFGSG